MRHARRGEQRGGPLGGGNEHGIPGRMRLVPGDVEIADAEHEVDPVDVGEGSRQARRVRDQKQEREREQRF